MSSKHNNNKKKKAKLIKAWGQKARATVGVECDNFNLIDKYPTIKITEM